MKTRTETGQTTSRQATIKPMRATLVKHVPIETDYVFEVKWDGYRIIAHCQEGQIKLQSRGGYDYTKRYPSIAKALKNIPTDCIIDGEVVYLNTAGKPDFDALQKVKGEKAPLVYYVFDLLSLNGKNLMDEPLLARKKLLFHLLSKIDHDAIRFSDHFDNGTILFEHVRKIGLEGVVAKQKESKYLPNEKSHHWLKIPIETKQEFIIGGWVDSPKTNTFRTLLFGAYDHGKLKWVGHAGGGYKERDMPQILKTLQTLETRKSPFYNKVEYHEGNPHWVKPLLIANFKFATLTKAGRIRKPAIFIGFRDDKKPAEVILETPEATTDPQPLKPKKKGNVKDIDGNNAIAKRVLPASPDSNWPALEGEVIRSQKALRIENCSITLYNVDRQIWRDVSKGDLIQYYNTISKYILPHVHNRALTLHIKPKGVHAPGLYIKDMEQRQPQCAEIFTTPRKHKKAGKREMMDYLVCNNTATLLYIINLGCIDINPWTSTIENPLHPNFIVIDLDPTDDDFKKVIETAQATKQFLDEYRLKAFIKTSGKTGMHIYVPCSSFTFPQARDIAENICYEIHALVPSITTTATTVFDRGKKLYLDPSQNDYADTVASAYSARPYKYPTVSTPLQWKEVGPDLKPEMFTIRTIHQRLQKKGDPFLGTHDANLAIKNNRPLKRFL